MNCPLCSLELVISERQGIEIDYCPKCRGVWLDRGELDKIIERSAGFSDASAAARTAGPSAASPAPAFYGAEQRGRPYQPVQHSYHQEQGGYHDHHGHKGHTGRKRKSFLEEIFDFD